MIRKASRDGRSGSGAVEQVPVQSKRLLTAIVAVSVCACSGGPERPRKLQIEIRQDAAHVYVTFTNPNGHLVANHVHYTLSLRDQHGAFLAAYLEQDRA